jgi:hypothetical protein
VERRRSERRERASVEEQLRMIGWTLVLLERPWQEPASKGDFTAVAPAKPALERRRS